MIDAVTAADAARCSRGEDDVCRMTGAGWASSQAEVKLGENKGLGLLKVTVIRVDTISADETRERGEGWHLQWRQISDAPAKAGHPLTH